MFPRHGDDDGHFFGTSSHRWDGTIDMKRINYKKKQTAKKEPHPSKHIKRCLYLEDDNNSTTNKPKGQALEVHKKKGKWKKLNLFVCGCGFC
jgi:hypothetical protein